jgi:DNA-binding GntR family transcriptional regulator
MATTQQPTGLEVGDLARELGPARRVTLRESVYESLRGMLMDHRLTPGSKLSIDGLARSLEVSQTPVREALTRLESDGLVVKKANAGFFVAPLLSGRELADTYELRLMIEPPTARHAATRRTEEHLRVLRDCVAHMHPVTQDAYRAYRDFVASDIRLHTTLAEAAGNLLVTDLLVRLSPQTQAFRATANTPFTADSQHEHEQIVQAVIDGDGDRAERAMREHLTRSRDRILGALDH